eukprot:TRINITY_DN3636_c0_g2_i1.p1 TRINITY_DN3636_c0_g2~~TRINITY_DN3636_c0_g2_i1.p1  ORF type:complete len:222 (-),score=20.40 TRINITY_DN3636_c0_g2_i1:120-746(-)
MVEFRRVLAMVCVVMASLTSIALIIISFTQISNNTTTPGGSYLDSIGSSGDPCASAEIYKSHLPFRARFQEDPDFLFCTWPGANSASRIVQGFLGIVLGIFIFIVLLKKGTRIFKLIAVIGCGLCVIWTFGNLINDGAATNNGRTWCDGRMSGAILTPPDIKITCDSGPYIGSCILDLWAAICWLATGLILVAEFCSCCKGKAAKPQP